MFKTRLDTFGNDFEQFSNSENFLIFLKISKNRPSMEHWAKFFFGKITPKHVQNTFDTFGNDFGHFSIFENFLIFLKIFEDSTLQLGKNFFSEKLPQNMFKTRLDTFGNNFGHFWIFENFLIFLKVFEDSTVHGTLGKFFFRKKLP